MRNGFSLNTFDLILCDKVVDELCFNTVTSIQVLLDIAQKSSGKNILECSRVVSSNADYR